MLSVPIQQHFTSLRSLSSMLLITLDHVIPFSTTPYPKNNHNQLSILCTLLCSDVSENETIHQAKKKTRFPIKSVERYTHITTNIATLQSACQFSHNFDVRRQTPDATPGYEFLRIDSFFVCSLLSV
jgi:hypothetical protein